MLFLKNLLVIVVSIIIGFLMLASCVPAMPVVLYIWPISIPTAIVIGTYCYTYDTSPEKIIEDLLKKKSN